MERNEFKEYNALKGVCFILYNALGVAIPENSVFRSWSLRRKEQFKFFFSAFATSYFNKKCWSRHCSIFNKLTLILSKIISFSKKKYSSTNSSIIDLLFLKEKFFFYLKMKSSKQNDIKKV